jgi:hypothetical protein
VRLVLGSHYLDAPGGAVTYFATVAEHLQGLGHDVQAFTHDSGTMAEWLRGRGIAVCGPEDLPETCDAVLVQDAPCAYELAERYPRAGQVFVSHGAEFDMEVPPQVPGVVGVVVVLNERVRRRVEATALDVEIVRLRQPIDFNRFRPRGEPPERPRRAVLLGNYLKGERRDLVTAALERAGIEWSQLGLQKEIIIDPAGGLADADIVIGYGRSILEGMSAGCAAYVYEFSVDGWVTEESYDALEADGFAGTAFDERIGPERLAHDLEAYDGRMGLLNRELVGTRHSPFEHANELAELLDGVAERRTPAEPRTELARIVRLEWAAHLRALYFEREAARSQRQAFEAERRAVAAERRALEAEGRLEEFRRSLRYRLASALAAPLERLLRRRR